MKKLLSTLLCLLPFIAWPADINETNIPIAVIGAVTTNDYIRILTNCAINMANGKTRLLKVGDLLSLVPPSTGGTQVWTNDGNGIFTTDADFTGYMSSEYVIFGYDIIPDITNVFSSIVGIGDSSLEYSEIDSTDDITAIGDKNGYATILQSCADFVMLGDYVCGDATFDTSGNVIAIGDQNFSGIAVNWTNVHHVVGIGRQIASSSTLTNSGDLVFIGAHIASSPFSGSWNDIILVGTDTEAPAGVVSNSVAIGKNATVTGSRQFVLGSNVTVVVSGTTNQVKFGFTNAPPTVNPSAVAKWISVQVGSETNAYRLPLYE